MSSKFHVMVIFFVLEVCDSFLKANGDKVNISKKVCLELFTIVVGL